jgi:hypothetical protein
MNGEFEWKSLRVGKYGGIDVVGFKTAPEHSVLAGQTLTHFIDNFPDEATARKAYPEVEGFINNYTAPPVSVEHLPSEDDPVKGGMYPDDY